LEITAVLRLFTSASIFISGKNMVLDCGFVQPNVDGITGRLIFYECPMVMTNFLPAVGCINILKKIKKNT